MLINSGVYPASITSSVPTIPIHLCSYSCSYLLPCTRPKSKEPRWPERSRHDVVHEKPEDSPHYQITDDLREIGSLYYCHDFEMRLYCIEC